MSKKNKSAEGGKSQIEETEKEKPQSEADKDAEEPEEKRTGEYRIKETEEDIAADSGKEASDANPDAFKEEIKKEAERSDVLMKYLVPIIVFLLVGGAVSAATWYYAKPERAQKTEEKIQTPPEVKEEPTAPPPATTTQPTTPAPAPEKKETTYTVKEGDTMSSIANVNGLTSQELAAYNGITDVNSLHIGQVLKIPVK